MKPLKKEIEEILKDLGLNHNTWKDEVVEPYTNQILKAIEARLPEEKKLKKSAINVSFNPTKEHYKKGYNQALKETRKALGLDE